MTQGRKLNVIALISGGKDSLYSIAHCQRNGHEVVALGNLYPPPPRREAREDGQSVDKGAQRDDDDYGDDDGEDMDSFLYQTIGHGVVPLYEEALGIPMYRDVIRGSALNAEREYSHHSVASSAATEKADAQDEDSDGDETESLFRLLRRIIEIHPSASAVSAGAILSTYQRSRIENVAARLGLVPLAWLWMYPYLAPPSPRAHSASVTGLLDDMAAAGSEVRIVKVASAGLESADVLWGDVTSPDGRIRRTLVNTMGKFLDDGLEAAALGEGGEYESLALNGPACLWKKRIAVDEVKPVVGEGGVMSARIMKARCAPKEPVAESEGDLACIRKPELFDEDFYKLLTTTKEKWEPICCPAEEKPDGERGDSALPNPRKDEESWRMQMFQSKGRDTWYIANCSAPEAGTDSASQMQGIVEKFGTLFQGSRSEQRDEPTPCADDIVFTTILLRSMSDFVAVNAVYTSMFVKPHPPARVTMACGDCLPAGVNVVISCVIHTGLQASRHGLHIQSRSYWAPANIGPYSQAISVPLRKNTTLEDDGGLVYVAGQIPLDPSTMELATPVAVGEDNWLRSFTTHAALSLQHLWRIGRAMEADWWLGGIAFLSQNDENTHFRASIAADMWDTMNTESKPDTDNEPDGSPTLDPWDIKYGRQSDLGKTSTILQRPLPNFSVRSASGVSATRAPPFFAVQIGELPRGAAIEWQGVGTRTPDFEISDEDRGDMWMVRSRGSGFGSSVYIGIRTVAHANVDAAVEKAVKLVEEDKTDDCPRQFSVVVYSACRVDCGRGACQVVPCRSVWGSDGRELIAGLVVHARPGP